MAGRTCVRGRKLETRIGVLRIGIAVPRGGLIAGRRRDAPHANSPRLLRTNGRNYVACTSFWSARESGRPPSFC